ncbi:hypothetical protein [Clostridium ljungdahlii]|uniref:Uncharacterized protein n=1 Tax=Clostridium ljungdahlii (strain ATCC 55383 / DSM 13528 / PETC) TaxID=748727 RepID=D8GMF2_CLOLD|nr:hypothetical protein [Clostridium ljungdahlii]ADK13562.1 hypothetical protein CLJU_c04800 [Clostridium ljungdahlii DSM 13528]OAA89180.1 hypothetical protein WX45_02421 [Clostridium ljungdahlii DSM 13528]
MLKIWGKLVKHNKIVKDEVVALEGGENYQENLKSCILELCRKFDIEKPYWLPANLEEYNRRSKTSFNSDNFIDEFEFDKFEIEEIDDEK